MGRQTGIAVLIIALITLFMVASCGSDEQAIDQQQTDDSYAKQQAIDAANQAALDKAKQINVAPQLQITSPANGLTVSQSPLVIEWTATDDSNLPPMIEISLRNIESNALAVISPSSQSTGRFSYSAWQSQPAGDYEIQLKGTDAQGLSNIAFCRIKK